MPASLEERVSALEQQLGGGVPDQISPNYLTVDAAGNIGADFTGHVHAEGIDLDEQVGSAYDPVTALAWLDAAGVVREFLQGAILGPDHHQLQVVAGPAETGESARLFAFAEPSFSGISVSAEDGAGSVVNLLVRRDGAADFLQLVSGALRVIDFGTATLTWPGGSPLTAGLSIGHDLTRVPALILAMAVNLPSNPIVVGRTSTAPTTTTFEIRGRTSDGTSPAAATSTTVYWAAIG